MGNTALDGCHLMAAEQPSSAKQQPNGYAATFVYDLRCYNYVPDLRC